MLMAIVLTAALATIPTGVQAGPACPPKDSAIPLDLRSFHEDLPFLYVTVDAVVFQETNDEEGLQRNGGSCPGGSFDADLRLTP